MLFSDVWSENAALFKRLMKIQSNPPMLYYGLMLNFAYMYFSNTLYTQLNGFYHFPYRKIFHISFTIFLHPYVMFMNAINVVIILL